MKTKRIVLVVSGTAVAAALVAGLPSVSAQEPATVPVLSETQKLMGQLALARVENAQLRLELAKADAITLLKSLERPGYTLDVNSWTYQPAPAQ